MCSEWGALTLLPIRTRALLAGGSGLAGVRDLTGPARVFNGPTALTMERGIGLCLLDCTGPHNSLWVLASRDDMAMARVSVVRCAWIGSVVRGTHRRHRLLAASML